MRAHDLISQQISICSYGINKASSRLEYPQCFTQSGVRQVFDDFGHTTTSK